MNSLKKQFPLLSEKEIKEYTNINLKLIHDEREKCKNAEKFNEDLRKRCEILQKNLDAALKELKILRNKKENERTDISKQEYLD
tara:strand:+ start:291 stop:542 length:252 start_codon:yes stop_codon:yes gene_type:complete